MRVRKHIIDRLRQSPLECDKYWIEAIEARMKLDTRLGKVDNVEVKLGDMTVTLRDSEGNVTGFDVFHCDSCGRPINVRRLNASKVFKEGYWFTYNLDTQQQEDHELERVWKYGTLDYWGRRIEMPNSEAFGVAVVRDDNEILPVCLTNLNERGLPMSTYVTAVSRFIDIRDGHIWAEMYLDADNKQTKNGDGVYGTLFEHDERGNKVKETFVDMNGQPMADRDGDAYSIFKYDKKNRLTQWYDLDIDGKLAPDHWGIWKYRYRYSRWTEVMECLDNDGNLMDNGWGYAQVVTVRDKHGRQTEHYMVNAAGNRVKWNDGSYGERIVYFDKEDMHRYIALGPDGQPMLADAYCIREVSMDPVRRCLHTRNNDEKGKPYMSAKDDAVSLSRVDDIGRMVMQVGMDADFNEVVDDCFLTRYEENERAVTYLYINRFEAPVFHPKGYCAIRKVMDDKDRIVLEQYMNNTNVPVELPDGTCGVHIEYDDANGMQIMHYLDGDNKPVQNKRGVARIYTQKLDDGTQKAWREDLAGNKVPSDDGYVILQKRYDDKDREVFCMSYTEDGKPFRDNMGVCGFSITYDDNGTEVKTYLDEAGEPTTDKEGTCTVSTEYDDQGRISYICWFDKDGNPSGTQEGYYGKSMSYNDDGVLEREMFFDEFRQPIANRYGDYGVEYWWPDNGDTIYISLDKDGKPHQNNEGYTYRRRILDEKGRDKMHRFYGLDFKPFMDKKGDYGVEFIIDDEGRMQGWASLDAFGNRHLNNNGFAVEMGTSDEKGRPIEQRWQDLSGNPTRDPVGDYGVRHTYNDQEHSEERISLGPDYEPHENERGFVSQTIWYDDLERTIKLAFHDQYGNPAVNEDGNSIEEIHYFSEDESHRERACYDAYGNLRTCDEGYAFLEISDDEKGRRILQMYYDEEHRPCTNPDGAYGIMIDYDEERGVELWSDLDDCGLPRVSNLGIAYSERVFDNRERPLKVRFLNHKHKPVQDKYGCEAYTYSYAKGTRIIHCCDGEFRPKMCNKGYAKCVQMTDASGEMKRLYLDLNGFWVDIYDDDEMD